MGERQNDREKELAKLEKELADKKAEIEARHAAIAKLPAKVPSPRFVHAFKLYGSRVGMTWGDSFKTYGAPENPTLTEALAMLAEFREPVDLWTVKGACLAIKPEAAITPAERERDEIHGPYYGLKIHAEYLSGAKLEGYVPYGEGELLHVTIHLARGHNFGGWVAEATGRYAHVDHDNENSYRLRAKPAILGETRLIKYAGGGYTGRSSANTLVYLFDTRGPLEVLGAEMDKAHAEMQARLKPVAVQP